MTSQWGARVFKHKAGMLWLGRSRGSDAEGWMQDPHPRVLKERLS